METVAKIALFVAAQERMRRARIGFEPQIREPTINRRHIDGPYFVALDGQLSWLTLRERLMTKLGLWDAWDIEWRRFPLPIESGEHLRVEERG